MKRAKIAKLLTTTGLSSLISRALPWSGVMCLNYHRIGDGSSSEFDRGLWSATAEEFDAQVGLLKSQFDVISPEDLPNVVSRRKGRYVLITFDDGYFDNYATAFPILRRHQTPATFFICTGFVDNPRLPWWDEIAWMVRTSKRKQIELPSFVPLPVVFDEPDREQAVRTLLRVYKSMPSESTGGYLEALAQATGSGRYNFTGDKNLWMTWDMLREMRMAGMSVGGHTVNHPILARMPRERQWEEISQCGQRIAMELNEPMRYFSYPVGGRSAFNCDTQDCLREVGVQYAFSYYGGFRQIGDWEDYDIRRVAVESYLTPSWFRAIVKLPQLFARQ